MSTPRLSVVVRAKDEAPSIGRTLDLLARQSVGRDALQVVVVDSGSTDGTDRIAEERGAELIRIPAASFTYGGALNTGAEAARADVVVALSAHAFATDDEWLARMLAALEDPAVACASGEERGPDRRRIDGRITQDLDLARRFPFWGYSNSAGAFRRELWAQRPFREDMPFSEDKEWAWHWLQRGHTAVIGPDLCVDHTHAKDPVRVQFRRERQMWTAYAMYLDLEPYTARDALREWLFDHGTYRARYRALLSHRRAAKLAGRYAALRSASSSRYSAA